MINRVVRFSEPSMWDITERINDYLKRCKDSETVVIDIKYLKESERRYTAMLHITNNFRKDF